MNRFLDEKFTTGLRSFGSSITIYIYIYIRIAAYPASKNYVFNNEQIQKLFLIWYLVFISLMGRMFAERTGFNPWSSHTKNSKNDY